MKKDLTDEIKEIVVDAQFKLYKLGMTKETMKRAMSGDEIKTCPYCDTHNMVIVHSKKSSREWECLFCGKPWLEKR